MASIEQDTIISPTSLAPKGKNSIASPLSKDFSMDNVVANRSDNNQPDDDADSSDSSRDSETKPLFGNNPRVVEGPSTVVRRRRNVVGTKAEPKQIRCDCHEQPKPTDTAARNRLMVACAIVLVFMIGEVVGWSREGVCLCIPQGRVIC